MEGLELLTRATAAGLTVEARGHELVVKGPKRAKAIAMALIKHKNAVLAALATRMAKSVASTGHTQRQLIVQQEPVLNRVEEVQGGKCATITLGDKTYELRQFHSMWFFRLTPEAGWTCCSSEFVKIIAGTQ